MAPEPVDAGSRAVESPTRYDRGRSMGTDAGDEGPLLGSPPIPSAKRAWALPLTVTLSCFAWLFYTNAYVCDDAFIAFRSVDNLVRGLGLRWNVAERVQVFTSPLFTLLLAAPYAFVYEPEEVPLPGRIHAVVLVVSFVLSAGTLAWLTIRLRHRPQLGVMIALLFSSQAFLIFTSSGLETPLLYLLVGIFTVEFLFSEPLASRGRLGGLMLLAGLGVLARHDALLLFLLPCTYLLVNGTRRFGRGVLAPVAAGLLPVVLWTGFALLYFGFPFPNSYYAKLGQGVSQEVLWRMGFDYLRQALAQDPITPVAIALAGVAGVLGARRDPRPALAALGGVSYVAYVVAVGGDFIGFRFLAPPMLVAALVLYRWGAVPGPRFGWWTAGLAIGGLLAYSVAVPGSPLRAYTWGERPFDVAFYLPASGLASWKPGLEFPFLPAGRNVRRPNAWNHPDDCGVLRRAGARVVVWGDGLNAFCRGPATYVIDPHGITDPLMARLRKRIDRPFHPGHYSKELPLGYVETRVEGRNLIADPALASYYARLEKVVSGPLLSWERVRAILELNRPSLRGYQQPYRVRPRVPREGEP